MAGLYVSGVKKPYGCTFCPWCRTTYSFCKAANKNISVLEMNKGPDWCPLVEVPDHGDLIDRDALIESFHVSRELCMKWANEVEGHDEESFLRAEQTHATFVEAILRTKAQEAIIPADKEEVDE